MRRKGQVIFEVFILALVAVFIITSFSYPPMARMVPLFVGLLTFILIIFQLIGKKAPRSASQNGLQEGSAGEEAPEAAPDLGKKYLRIILWMAALYLSIFLLGFIFGLALYFFLYLRLAGKEGWAVSIIYPVATAALIYFGFVRALEMYLYPGLLLKL